MKHPDEDYVRAVLASALFAESYEGVHGGVLESLDDQNFQTVGVQLRALGLVKIEYSQTTTGSMGLFWSFTAPGERLMVEVRAVRTKPAV